MSDLFEYEIVDSFFSDTKAVDEFIASGHQKIRLPGIRPNRDVVTVEVTRGRAIKKRIADAVDIENYTEAARLKALLG